MRISTSMLYDSGTRNIQRHQSELAELQAKVAAGRRVLKPSDDPISAAGATVVRQAKGVNAQYQANAVNAESALAQEEDALAQATRVLQDVKTLTVQAGNASLSNGDRASIATSLKGLYSELLGIANRTDGNGQYLFSGMQGGTQPFSETSPGNVAYAGDQGARLMQTGPQRRIAVGDNGAEIFQRIREGNGTFVANVAAGNTGSAVADVGTVTNPQAWANPANSGDYTIRFDVDPAGVTTYDIVDNGIAPPRSMLTGVAAAAAGPYTRVYQAGAAISFKSQGAEPAFDAGVQLNVKGAPADGDTIQLRPAGSQDVFTSLHKLITTLESGASTAPSSRAAYQNGLNHALNDIDRGLDQVLTARSSVGSRLQELEALQTTTEDMAVHYDEELSRLQDLDYAQALTDLERRQFNLEAAQRSFMLVNRLSLFDLL
jgi:flagellar hook-associated protein 3 FlgL